MNTWVLVADSRKARVLAAADKYHEPVELEGFIYPDAQAIRGEHPDSHPTRGRIRNSLQAPTSPKAREAQKFAAELVNHLEKEFAVHHFSELILIAPPDFLGTLRAQLSPSLNKALKHSISKDLTVCSAAQLLEYTRDHLTSLH